MRNSYNSNYPYNPRVWDVLMVEGPDTLSLTLLGLLKKHSTTLVAEKGPIYNFNNLNNPSDSISSSR